MQEPSLEREKGTEPLKKKIILFAEGKNTETSYFKQFNSSLVTIETVGTGKSTCKLVNEAIILLRSKYKNKPSKL